MQQEPSLEASNPKEPDLRRITDELNQAAIDAGTYLRGLDRCRGWWQNIWDGQAYDGRRHATVEGEVIMPWDNCSDSRLRIVATLVNDHVSIIKGAIRRARLSVKSTRPLLYGRIANIAQKVLEWHIYTQMRREILREYTFALKWKYAIGFSIMGIEWEQQRAKTSEVITIEDLVEISQKLGTPELADLGGGEESEQAIAVFLQRLSPKLSDDEARSIVYDLRNEGTATLPVVQLAVNKPKWTAYLPCIDVIFPSETYELQTGRFTSRRELLTEWELKDRVATDGYNEDFVNEALNHKGKFASWIQNPQWGFIGANNDSDRDMIELHHFLYRNVEDGVPCMYRVVFNYSCSETNAPVAVNRVFEYKHQQQPFVSLRRSHDFRPLLSSIGIAEEAYTDEIDIKTQQDGLNDRSEIILNPPIILPTLRAQGLANQYGPRKVMGALRPQEVSWPPLPPSDETPVAIIGMVEKRLAERYSIKGVELDPQMKAFRQQELADDNFVEYELMLEQTLKLAQQFDTDETVQRVAGMSGQPWQVSSKDILGDYEISVTTDMQMSDMDYVTKRMGLYMQALQMNGAGTANMTKLFQRVLAIADPDAEDLIDQDQGSVTEREVGDEKNAIAQIMTGQEPSFPQHGNHQLRLQTLIQGTLQSPNPWVQQQIASRKDVQVLLKNRIKNHQNQIQQYQVNPQIGRTVTTSAFQPAQPAQLTTGDMT